jgi:hypothetical protein
MIPSVTSGSANRVVGEAAPHDGSVHCRDHGHVQRFQRVEQHAVFDLARRAAELADVGAREKGRSLAHQDDRAHAAFGPQR